MVRPAAGIRPFDWSARWMTFLASLLAERAVLAPYKTAIDEACVRLFAAGLPEPDGSTVGADTELQLVWDRGAQHFSVSIESAEIGRWFSRDRESAVCATGRAFLLAPDSQFRRAVQNLLRATVTP